MRAFFPVVFGLALLSAGAASAEVVKYKLDKPHTQIIFSVDHLGFSKSYGKFTDYMGEISWDKEKPENSSVSAAIKTGSLDMGDATWNEHMLSPKFFDAAKFPDMTFKSTGIQKTGENTANITGDLTLHGVTRPVVLATTLRKAGKHPFTKGEAAGFTASGKIKRSDFGMAEAIPMVGDEVDITLEVEAFQETPDAGNK